MPDHVTPARRGRDRLVLAVAAVALLALNAVLVLPPPSQLGSRVTPNAGDPVLITWILEHQARALLTDPTELYAANIFFPEPSAIAWSDNLTAFVPPFLAVWLLSGRDPVLAYNVVTWLAFAGGSLAVLLLARRLLRSPVAATVVAVAFTLAMVRRSAVGHTQLAGFLFLPLALVLLMDLVERRRVTTAALAGACLAGLWYTAIYFFVLAVVVVPLFLVVSAPRNRDRLGVRLLGLVAGAAAVAALLVAPSLPPYLDLQEDDTFERGDDELLTIGPASFHQPPSPVYEALDQADGVSEGTDGFVGWLPAVLAALAAAGALVDGARRVLRRAGSRSPRTRRERRRWTAEERRRRFWPGLAVACTAGGLLALGPDDGLLSVPYDALRPVVPGLASARALNRFWVLPALGVALLAGRGVERLVGRRRAAVQLVAGAVVVTLAVAELVSVPESAEVELAPEQLAVNEVLDDLDRGAVTELPVPGLPHYPYVLAARQLRSLRDGLPRVEGYSGDAPPGLATYLQATSTFPSEEAVAAMRHAGVRHVVLHGGERPCAGRYGPREMAGIVAAATRVDGVESVTRVGRSAIVTLAPGAPRRPLSAIPPVAPAARSTDGC